MPGSGPFPDVKPRRLVRLSVRALMAVVLVVGGGLGWMAERARVQRDAASAIVRAGGSVSYSWNGQALNVARGRTMPSWLQPLVRVFGIDYFATIETVDLPDNTTDDALMVHVGKLRGLTTLPMYGIRAVTDRGLVPLRNLHRLEVLRIYGSAVQGPGLACVEGMPRLKALDLADIPLTDADLSHVAVLTALTELKLASAQVTDNGMVYLKNARSLRELDLLRSPVTSAGLASLRGMNSLGILHLNATRVESLKPLEGLSGLYELELARTPIDDTGMAPIAGFSELRRLDLARTRVTDEGMRALSGLPLLNRLNLSHTAITDRGLQPLSRLPNLGTLDLTGTQVTDEGLMKILVTSKRLRGLTVKGTKVTAEGVSAYRKSHPLGWIVR